VTAQPSTPPIDALQKDLMTLCGTKEERPPCGGLSEEEIE
jgi:hypothetical protein